MRNFSSLARHVLSPVARRLERLAMNAPGSKVLALVLSGLLLLLTGCGGQDNVGATIPVSGKVLLDGKPLTTGTVNYVPDAAKGNKLQGIVVGPIANGEYQLQTSSVTMNKAGAPPGWYKVTVQTMAPPGANATQGQPMSQGPPVAAKFTNPQQTPLEVEVKEGAPPGHYDLQVTSK